LSSAAQPDSPDDPPSRAHLRVANANALPQPVTEISGAVIDLPQVHDNHMQNRQEDTRSQLIRYVILCFCFVCCALVLTGCVVVVFGTPEKVAALKELEAVVGTFMLPVVTLMIGYYFGKSGR